MYYDDDCYYAPPKPIGTVSAFDHAYGMDDDDAEPCGIEQLAKANRELRDHLAILRMTMEGYCSIAEGILNKCEGGIHAQS